MPWGNNKQARQDARSARKAQKQAWRETKFAARTERQKTRQGFLSQLGSQAITAFAPANQPGKLMDDGSVYQGEGTSTPEPASAGLNPMMIALLVGAFLLMKKK